MSVLLTVNIVSHNPWLYITHLLHNNDNMYIYTRYNHRTISLYDNCIFHNKTRIMHNNCQSISTILASIEQIFKFKQLTKPHLPRDTVSETDNIYQWLGGQVNRCSSPVRPWSDYLQGPICSG